MTWDDLLAYCLAKPGAWQDEPWEGDVVVKVGTKIIAFFGSGQSASVGLKCGTSREPADEWLLRYPDDAWVMAYIGRSGWNTLRIGAAIGDDELMEAVDASYAAIVSKLPRKDRPVPTLCLDVSWIAVVFNADGCGPRPAAARLGVSPRDGTPPARSSSPT
jgi:predicted DNA-binding protein (MmcQ/YjbR family)